MPSIDQLCDKFESQLRHGKARPLGTYLDLFSGDKTECLNQLLQIELEYLILRGVHIKERDYHQEYPGHPRAVVFAFDEIRRRFPEAFAAMTDDGAESDQASKVVLRVTQGPSLGRELTFTAHQTCIVGRAKDAHLQLSPNRECSRFHCRLEINPPEIVVVDLGSTNGTRVNGQKVESATLATGDEVTIGDTCFTVTIVHNLPQPDTSPPTHTGSQWNDESFDSAAPHIPGYVVEKQVGHGSMGVVYIARRIATNEKVAVKVVRPMVATNPKAVEKFRREAAIVLRLQHKRIVKSLDFRLTDDHLPYLVMEYIEEVNLRELLDAASAQDRRRMAAGIMARALEGLQYAHDHEIVHRDVKPSNLLVYRNGRKLQVKVADFGLAKNFIDAGFSDCSTSNEICGTLAYMPPEQIIDCRHAKPTCDIYAAGVCLYNMISSRLPYEASTVAQQISLILNSAPRPITDHVRELPRGLRTILDRALSREPAQRYATAEEMKRALLPYTKRPSSQNIQ